MRKIVIALALAVSLGACAQLQSAFNFATTPVAVTPAMLNDAEKALTIVSSGLVAYRRLCIKKVIDPVTRQCRVVMANLQQYTIPAKAALIDMRTAVRANDQITALRAYSALQALVTAIQAERAKAGV